MKAGFLLKPWFLQIVVAVLALHALIQGYVWPMAASNWVALSKVRAIRVSSLDNVLDKKGLLWNSFEIRRISLSPEGEQLRVSTAVLRQSIGQVYGSEMLLRNLGQASLLAGDYTQALEALLQAKRLGSYDAITDWSLGNVYWHTGQVDSARQVWRKSGMKDVFVWRHVEPAQQAFDKGNWQASVELALQALEIDPEEPFPYYLLGQSYEQMGRYDMAIVYYQSAGRLADNGVWFKTSSYSQIGQIYREKLGLREQALEAFEESVRIDSSNAWAWINVGHIKLESRDLDGAEFAYRKAAYPAPGIATAHWGLGKVALQRADLQEAIKEFEIAVSLQPSAIDFRIALGDAYLIDKDKAKAEVQFKSVLEIDPSNSYARKQLDSLDLK